jgi:hypothetical protein
MNILQPRQCLHRTRAIRPALEILDERTVPTVAPLSVLRTLAQAMEAQQVVGSSAAALIGSGPRTARPALQARQLAAANLESSFTQHFVSTLVQFNNLYLGQIRRLNNYYAMRQGVFRLDLMKNILKDTAQNLAQYSGEFTAEYNSFQNDFLGRLQRFNGLFFSRWNHLAPKFSQYTGSGEMMQKSLVKSSGIVSSWTVGDTTDPYTYFSNNFHELATNYSNLYSNIFSYYSNLFSKTLSDYLAHGLFDSYTFNVAFFAGYTTYGATYYRELSTYYANYSGGFSNYG